MVPTPRLRMAQLALEEMDQRVPRLRMAQLALGAAPLGEAVEVLKPPRDHVLKPLPQVGDAMGAPSKHHILKQTILRHKDYHHRDEREQQFLPGVLSCLT